MEKDKKNINSYDDIIKLPHHVSASHPHMPILDRAAQFAPFAALTGHGAAIKETARLTNRRIELDENRKEILNDTLRTLAEKIGKGPVIAVTYFKPDQRKDGGSYITVEGILKKLDQYKGRLILEDGTQISVDDIVEMEEL